MSKLTKKVKGQISRETEKALQIIIIKNGELFDEWIPKSALNMKEMDENYLTVIGMQTFHIHQWFLDLKKEEKEKENKVAMDNTTQQFLETADRVTTEIASLNPIGGNSRLKKELIKKKTDVKVGETMTVQREQELQKAGYIIVDIPQPPTPDRVEFPYFPGMTIFELRDYHMHEQNGAIRGHIENIIIAMEASDQRLTIIKLLEAVKK